MRLRSGKIDVVKILMVLIVVGSGFYVAVITPHYWIKYKMDEIVQVSLLEWRDRSQAKAQERLLHELDKQEIPTYIIPKDCNIYEEKGERHVRCEWAVNVVFPVINQVQHLEFGAHKYLDAKGLMETLE